jgi:flagellin-like protein
MTDKRGVSAVIATVIIVAVTIAIAMAVAYWMGGLVTIFTRFEKLVFRDVNVVVVEDHYVVNVIVENTGATPTKVSQILLNGVPIADYDLFVEVSSSLEADFLYSPNENHLGYVIIPYGAEDPSGNRLDQGTNLTITIHTSGGKDYHAEVVLP